MAWTMHSSRFAPSMKSSLEMWPFSFWKWFSVLSYESPPHSRIFPDDLRLERPMDCRFTEPWMKLTRAIRPKTLSTLSSGVSSPRLSDAFGPTMSKIERTTVRISCLVITLLWSETVIIKKIAGPSNATCDSPRPIFPGNHRYWSSPRSYSRKAQSSLSSRLPREVIESANINSSNSIVPESSSSNTSKTYLTKSFKESVVSLMTDTYNHLQCKLFWVSIGKELFINATKCLRLKSTDCYQPVRLVWQEVCESLAWGVKTPPGQSRINPWRQAFISFAYFWYGKPGSPDGEKSCSDSLVPDPVKFVFAAKFSYEIIQH